MTSWLRDVGLVMAGGTVGTAARETLILAIPTVARLPLAILTANVVGAFALGLLLESLTLRGDDSGTRRHVRLLLGTGVLGGFTTYSALSLDVAALYGLGGSALAVWCLVWRALGAALRPRERGIGHKKRPLHDADAFCGGCVGRWAWSRLEVCG